jgi:hypothetical protein
MNTAAEIIEAARQRILAHRIECSMDLLGYLRLRASLEDIPLERLQEEAVRQGLYRYLGERYAWALQSAISQARSAVQMGLIGSEAELAAFIQTKGDSLERFRREDRTLSDLFIDARQGGLYELIAPLGRGDQDGSTNNSHGSQWHSAYSRSRSDYGTHGGIEVHGKIK